jgi:hypothetical protein
MKSVGTTPLLKAEVFYPLTTKASNEGWGKEQPGWLLPSVKGQAKHSCRATATIRQPH